MCRKMWGPAWKSASSGSKRRSGGSPRQVRLIARSRVTPIWRLSVQGCWARQRAPPGVLIQPLSLGINAAAGRSTCGGLVPSSPERSGVVIRPSKRNLAENSRGARRSVIPFCSESPPNSPIPAHIRIQARPGEHRHITAIYNRSASPRSANIGLFLAVLDHGPSKPRVAGSSPAGRAFSGQIS